LRAEFNEVKGFRSQKVLENEVEECGDHEGYIEVPDFGFEKAFKVVVPDMEGIIRQKTAYKKEGAQQEPLHRINDAWVGKDEVAMDKKQQKKSGNL
jgi:hypothetical protein